MICNTCGMDKKEEEFKWRESKGSFCKSCISCNAMKYAARRRRRGNAKCDNCGGPPTEADWEHNYGKLNYLRGNMLCSECLNPPRNRDAEIAFLTYQHYTDNYEI